MPPPVPAAPGQRVSHCITESCFKDHSHSWTSPLALAYWYKDRIWSAAEAHADAKILPTTGQLPTRTPPGTTTTSPTGPSQALIPGLWAGMETAALKAINYEKMREITLPQVSEKSSKPGDGPDPPT
ncbi:uncharacterized protein LOC144366229 [Ictidomys tridecemlineatus]